MPSVQDATQWVGPMILFLLMIVVGLELTPADFRRVVSAPRAVIGGTLAQIALLPLLDVGGRRGVRRVAGARRGRDPRRGRAERGHHDAARGACARERRARGDTHRDRVGAVHVTLPTIAAFGLRVLLGEIVAIEVPVGALIGTARALAPAADRDRHDACGRGGRSSSRGIWAVSSAR
jgi:hypothetical protein